MAHFGREINDTKKDDSEPYVSDEEEEDTFEDKSHQKHDSKLLETFQKQRQERKNIDLEVKVKINEKIELLPVHKFVLYAYCPYIKTFLDNALEKPTKTIDLTHLDGESVSEIINWVYTGEINFSDENARDILISADFLCIEEIVKLSIRHISSNFTFQNCSDIYMISSSYSSFECLKNTVSRFIVVNFFPLLNECFLDDLPIEDIINFASSDLLILFFGDFVERSERDQEYYLFKAFIEYINRKKLHNSWKDVLIKSIRLGFFHAKDIENLINNDEWLGNCEDKSACIQLLKNRNNFQYPIWTVRRQNLKGFSETPSSIFAYTGTFDMSRAKFFNDYDKEMKKHNFDTSLIIIRAMKIFLRKWNGITVVGGFEITYNGGMVYSHGLNSASSHNVFEFKLKYGEYINKVTHRSGHVVDCLTFYTNFGAVYGPYGGKGGGEKTETPHKSGGFLAAISGTVVETNDALATVSLQLHWGRSNKILKPYFLYLKSANL